MTDTPRASHAEMNADCEAAIAGRLPVLLAGPDTTTDDWIQHMEPGLALPVIDVACDAGVNTTALDDAGTVILHDVDYLRPRDQEHLLQWLERTRQRAHIISTSSRALYPLVRAGCFSENLYYRLNSVYLDCTSPTIIELLTLPDEHGIEEFPVQERAQAAVRLPVPSGLPALFSTGRNQLALTSCALGVVTGAVLTWALTAPSQSAGVPGESSARIQEGRAQPALPPQGPDVAATLQSSSRSVPSPRATTNQPETVAIARTAQRAAARPRRTVFRGALAVNSRPTGARVSINGQSLGVTPMTVNHLPAGSRVVRVTAQGYHPWSSAVRVVANQRNSVMVTLQRLPD